MNRFFTILLVLSVLIGCSTMSKDATRLLRIDETANQERFTKYYTNEGVLDKTIDEKTTIITKTTDSTEKKSKKLPVSKTVSGAFNIYIIGIICGIIAVVLVYLKFIRR